MRPAADANRHFSKILRDVKAGETVLVTSRGEPVAQIIPFVDQAKVKAERKLAWQALFNRLDSQPAMNLGRFNRDELYDDDDDD